MKSVTFIGVTGYIINSSQLPPFVKTIARGTEMSDLLQTISESLITGQIGEVAKLTQEAVDQGKEAQDILENGLLAGMDVVGQRFKAKELIAA
jgi:methanogenic corrinoid protein MtbC1